MHSWPISVEFHIRDQEALPATGERLSDDVDRLARERALERRPLGLQVSGENKIGRDALVEPAPALDAAEGLRGPVDCCFAERLRRWIGDERGDEDGRHGASRRAGKQVRRALLIAGPTASGKSAAALALAQAFGATIVNADSMQVYQDLQNPDRAADAGGGAAGAASPVRRHRRRGQFFRRTMGACCGRNSRGDRRTAGYFRRRHGPLFPRADRGPVGHPARARSRAGRGPKQGGRPRRIRTSRRAHGARSRDRRPPQPERPAAHLARARGARRYGTSARLVPRRAHGAGVQRPANGRGSISRQTGRRLAGASTRGSTPCSRAACSTKSRR